MPALARSSPATASAAAPTSTDPAGAGTSAAWEVGEIEPSFADSAFFGDAGLSRASLVKEDVVKVALWLGLDGTEMRMFGPAWPEVPPPAFAAVAPLCELHCSLGCAGARAGVHGAGGAGGRGGVRLRFARPPFRSRLPDLDFFPFFRFPFFSCRPPKNPFGESGEAALPGVDGRRICERQLPNSICARCC